jgi:hypothetical protein
MTQVPGGNRVENGNESGSEASRSSGSTTTPFDAASHAADCLARSRSLASTQPAAEAASHAAAGGGSAMLMPDSSYWRTQRPMSRPETGRASAPLGLPCRTNTTRMSSIDANQIRVNACASAATAQDRPAAVGRKRFGRS